MLGRGGIGGGGGDGGAAGRGAAAGGAAGLGAGGAIGLGAGGAIGLGAGAAMGLGAGGAIGLGAAFAAALGFGAAFDLAALGLEAALRAFGFAFAFAFLAGGFLPELFLATARFLLARHSRLFRLSSSFLAFAFFDFLAFDFAFFAMIVLPIVSAQISVRLPVRTPKAPRRDIYLPYGQGRARPWVSIESPATQVAAASRASWRSRTNHQAQVLQATVPGHSRSATCKLPFHQSG